MSLTIFWMAVAYLLGWVHAKHGSVTNLAMTWWNRPVDAGIRDKNYCPECEAFLPSDNHKPMCSKRKP